MMISCAAPEAEVVVTDRDTVILVMPQDTLFIKKRCQEEIITQQLQRIAKIERKLNRIKKKLNGKNKKNIN